MFNSHSESQLNSQQHLLSKFRSGWYPGKATPVTGGEKEGGGQGASLMLLLFPAKGRGGGGNSWSLKCYLLPHTNFYFIHSQFGFSWACLEANGHFTTCYTRQPPAMPMPRLGLLFLIFS